MADDTRVGDSTVESDTLPPELREIESRFLQDSLVWGADLDGIARLTQLVQSLPGRKSTDTALVVMPVDGDPYADGVDSIEATPLDKHHPVKQSLGGRKSSSSWIAGVAALVIVALLAVVFSTLGPSHNTGTTATPTVTAEATATTEEATATPTHTPAPTATLTVAHVPTLTATFVIQSNGNNISATSQTTSCASSAQFSFEVDVQYSYAPAGYVTYHWQHYDGNSPGAPTTGPFSQSPSTPPRTDIIPTGSPPNGDRYGYNDSWTVEPADYSGSTPRWGDQFIITAINGKTLTTPIASHILHFPTGC